MRHFVLDPYRVQTVPALSVLGGSTFWLDATAPALLYTDNGVTNVASDGDLVVSARDATGKQRAFYKATSDQFEYRTNVVNGNSVLRAPGASTTRFMDLRATTAAGNGITTGGALPISTLLAASGKTVVFAAAWNPPDSTVRQAFGDDVGGYWYDRIILSGGNSQYAVHNFDGTTDTRNGSVTAGTWHVWTSRHDGTNLQLRVDAGSWSTVASGATSVLTGQARFGRGFTIQCFLGDVAHLATWDTALVDADCYEVEKYVGASVGLSL